MVGVLGEDVPSMTDEERAVISRWLTNAIFFWGNPKQMKETFLQTIKKGDVQPMKHAATVFMENKIAAAERKSAVAIARNMLINDEPVEKVVEYTGLDLNEVLKLKGEV